MLILDTNFNPRAPRGARPGAHDASRGRKISIHAPREGRDDSWLLISERQRDFNPRAPRGARLSLPRLAGLRRDFNPRAPRGARLAILIFVAVAVLISIHAPREGRDLFHASDKPSHRNFNPRAPRGARRLTRRNCWRIIHFNPRAPRGARRSRPVPSGSACHFNPRAPRGARPSRLPIQVIMDVLQSSRPARGATSNSPSSDHGE